MINQKQRNTYILWRTNFEFVFLVFGFELWASSQEQFAYRDQYLYYFHYWLFTREQQNKPHIVRFKCDWWWFPIARRLTSPHSIIPRWIGRQRVGKKNQSYAPKSMKSNQILFTIFNLLLTIFHAFNSSSRPATALILIQINRLLL